MADISLDRGALERQWELRLKKARLDLEKARANFLSTKDDASSGLFGPDGRFAYNRAIDRETAALIEYSRVLRLYTDVVLHGKTPEQDDPPPADGAVVG